MPVLEVEGITKRFGEEVAVDNLSLTVEKGQFKSLLGPSGCGKTTTLRSVAGLEKPDEGKIYLDGNLVFDGESGKNVNPEDRDIGMVFQSYAVWPHMTVRENVSFPLEMEKVPKQERETRIDEVLDTVGLAPHSEDLATNLSGGQQQRVAIARALVVEPEIILFDEPLASLDAKLRREMRMEIKRICDEFDITILYVTHSQDEAMFLSDEIAIMNDGKIVEEGAPKELHENPTQLFSMQFMGHTNALGTRILSRNGTAGTIETPMGDLEVGDIEDGLESGDDAMVTIRPKFIEMLTEGGADENNTFEGTVNYVAPTRDFTEYEIDVGGQVLTVKTATPMSVSRGDSVRLRIPPEAAKVWVSGA